eukprot:14292136-Ditylum_brightwellii.AAC.1
MVELSNQDTKEQMKQLETTFKQNNGRANDLCEKINIKSSSSQPIDIVTFQTIQKDVTEDNNATIKVADSLNDCLETLERVPIGNHNTLML